MPTPERWWCCYAGCRARHLLLRASWHRLRGVMVVAVVGCGVSVVGCGCCRRHAWACVGLHRQGMGARSIVVVSRLDCGVRLWLDACHLDWGWGKRKLSEALGNTRHAEFAVYCFADNFMCLHVQGLYITDTLGTFGLVGNFFLGVQVRSIGSIYCQRHYSCEPHELGLTCIELIRVSRG